MKTKKKTHRVMIEWNTGTRQHKPKKGKGSYNRRKQDDYSNDDRLFFTNMYFFQKKYNF